jgi:hypothetical protein
MQKLIRILVAGVWALAVAWGLTLSFQTLRAEARDDAGDSKQRVSGSTEALY